MTLVIATGGIDLSVGSLMAISGALAPLLFTNPALSPPLGLLLAFTLPVLAAGVGGIFNGALVTRFRIQPIIATLVLYIAGRGVAQVLTNGNLQSFRNPAFESLAYGRLLGVPYQVILMLGVVAVVAWVVRATVFGRYLEAVGDNEAAARLAGVPVDRVKTTVYLVSGLLAGVAGLIVVAINRASDANQVGLNMELDAIARRVHHPTYPLHPAGARRPRRGGLDRQGGGDRSGGVSATSAPRLGVVRVLGRLRMVC
jgi:simple sugar transport system permease protein/ribose transport system permease protein